MNVDSQFPLTQQPQSQPVPTTSMNVDSQFPLTQETLPTEQLELPPQVEQSKPSYGLLSIKNDHSLIKSNIERLFLLTDSEEKLRLFNDTVKLIAQHDVAEEVVFFPAVKNLGLKNMVDTSINQTIELEKHLYQMDSKYGKKIGDDVAFNTDLQILKDLFNNHASYLEQRELIPLLERNLGDKELESLNNWFDKIKVTAPTRPHPNGPHSAAGALAVGPIVSFIDHFRDLSKKFTQ
jgi:hypothetical protein